jgi:superfamily II DNA/RNA helicase
VDFVPSSIPAERDAFLDAHQIRITGSPAASALSWRELCLPSAISRVILDNDWLRPTPIQSASIPLALRGRDLIGIAKTGSGKTGAFVIPAVLHITVQAPMRPGDGPIVLVLCPTRELAQQTTDTATKFLLAVGHRSACIYGGAGRSEQIAALSQSPAFVVACPGRLIEYLDSGSARLDRVSFLVLDEADRMLDMGFEDQIRRIVAVISVDRQTMMFSATWPKSVRCFARTFLTDPVEVLLGGARLRRTSRLSLKAMETVKW